MEIIRAGSRPSGKGPAGQFTGTVRRDPLYSAHAPGRVQSGINTFEPGARTAWHTHPLGQTLFVMSGCGWVGRWHGASATTAVVHLAITEALDGTAASWMEHVSDEQYKL
jgi:quercetin dioxygenase-like cupin family protein